MLNASALRTPSRSLFLTVTSARGSSFSSPTPSASTTTTTNPFSSLKRASSSSGLGENPFTSCSFEEDTSFSLLSGPPAKPCFVETHETTLLPNSRKRSFRGSERPTKKTKRSLEFSPSRDLPCPSIPFPSFPSLTASFTTTTSSQQSGSLSPSRTTEISTPTTSVSSPSLAPPRGDTASCPILSSSDIPPFSLSSSPTNTRLQPPSRLTSESSGQFDSPVVIPLSLPPRTKVTIPRRRRRVLDYTCSPTKSSSTKSSSSSSSSTTSEGGPPPLQLLNLDLLTPTIPQRSRSRTAKSVAKKLAAGSSSAPVFEHSDRVVGSTKRRRQRESETIETNSREFGDSLTVCPTARKRQRFDQSENDDRNDGWLTTRSRLCPPMKKGCSSQRTKNICTNQTPSVERRRRGDVSQDQTPLRISITTPSNVTRTILTYSPNPSLSQQKADCIAREGSALTTLAPQTTTPYPSSFSSSSLLRTPKARGSLFSGSTSNAPLPFLSPESSHEASIDVITAAMAALRASTPAKSNQK